MDKLPAKSIKVRKFTKRKNAGKLICQEYQSHVTRSPRVKKHATECRARWCIQPHLWSYNSKYVRISTILPKYDDIKIKEGQWLSWTGMQHLDWYQYFYAERDTTDPTWIMTASIQGYPVLASLQATSNSLLSFQGICTNMSSTLI